MLEIYRGTDKKQGRKQAVELLRTVGIPEPEKRVNAFPHELSGGMAQRVMIAMALACEPKLLIADEPTTALDVTIQAQILDLMRGLQAKLGTSIILITHDMGVVAEMASRVSVMYAGRVVEQADVNSLFDEPLRPRTPGLDSGNGPRQRSAGHHSRLRTQPHRSPPWLQVCATLSSTRGEQPGHLHRTRAESDRVQARS